MKWTAAKKEFIVHIYFHQQYHSPRCWNTPGKEFKEYGRLGSESQKMKSVREQIQLCYLVMGFKQSHKPWSKYSVNYSPTHILTHLTAVFVTLKLTKTILNEPPMEVPTIPNLTSFGTMVPDVIPPHNYSGNKLANARKIPI